MNGIKKRRTEFIRLGPGVYFQGWLAFSAKQDELFTPSC
jgi:hypothetical protein